MAVAHYLEALKFQKEFIRIHAVLGGKNPHLQTFLVGGMATSMDPNEPNASINPERIDFLLETAKSANAFVNQVYVADVLAVAGFYPDWFSRGEGLGNFMCYGRIRREACTTLSNFYFPRGMLFGRDLSKVFPVDPSNVSEYVTHSWYDYTDGDDKSRHPFEGQTKPRYTGPKPPYEFLEVDQKYSWLKSPRYQDKAVEVGPLARLLIAYASGHAEVKTLIDGTLAKLKAPPTALFSTLGRIAARALETNLLATHVVKWIEELGGNLASGNVRIHNGEKWDPRPGRTGRAGSGFSRRRADRWGTG